MKRNALSGLYNMKERNSKGYNKEEVVTTDIQEARQVFSWLNNKLKLNNFIKEVL